MADSDIITIERDGYELDVTERDFRLYYKPLGWTQKTVVEMTREEVIAELDRLGANYDPDAKVGDLRLVLKALQAKPAKASAAKKS
ncbi:hypothetical protein [Exiguobacterium sp. s191]|uniref:hypothetical protein n=1 Tax=Exiguobacterium sp. s191 TaxID=2751196 RepID=UPI001BE622E8|nr:hypothetical protein [Exiguobacterium sp. s191]